MTLNKNTFNKTLVILPSYNIPESYTEWC